VVGAKLFSTILHYSAIYVKKKNRANAEERWKASVSLCVNLGSIANHVGKSNCNRSRGIQGENRGQRTFFLTREDLYGNIYLLWQEWQELSYQTYRIILLREVIIGK